MEKPRSNLVQKTPVFGSHGSKMERKYVEKNRRNQLKGLYNHLFSLVPSSSQETLPLPDQIDETINYIKTLKEKLEDMKQKREDLMSRKILPNSTSSTSHHHMEPPQIKIHEMGPTMAVVFITGLHNVATFNNIIRMVQEEGFEVANASFQLYGNSTLQIILGEPVGKWAMSRGGAGAITSVSKKLSEMISGKNSSEMESSSRLALWDYDIENEIWGLFDVAVPLQHNIEQHSKY